MSLAPPSLSPAAARSSAGAEPLLRVRALSKRFGALTVLDHIDLDIASGEFLTILGASGSGKTTLLRLIAGLETTDGGSIEMQGLRLDGLPPYRRPVNTVFQNYALFPHLSAFDNVAYGLRTERPRLPKDVIVTRAQAALAQVEMSAFSAALPGRLSGGQQQRVALARALVKRPKLLLLDEPLSALDANLRRAMQAELKSLQRQVGITFILVTHDQDEAMALSDRIALLRQGKMEQIATPQQMYRRPATAYVAQFVGQTNLLPGAVRAGCAHCLDWVWRVPAEFEPEREGEAEFSLRPDDIQLAGLSSSAGAVRFRARITACLFHGGSEQVSLRCASGLDLKARLSSRLPGVREGAEADFEFLPEHAVRLDAGGRG